MTDRKQIDWEAVERDYRAGVMSLREIGAAHGLTHGAIRKRAERDGWTRNLAARIEARAEALVSKAAVSTEVSKKQADTERVIVEANAEAIARIKLSHRTDIARSRSLAMGLMSELEAVTDQRGLLEELPAILATEGEAGSAQRVMLYQKVIDLPSRTTTMKALAETLKTLVSLERESYGMQKADLQPDGEQITRIELVSVRAAHRDS